MTGFTGTCAGGVQTILCANLIEQLLEQQEMSFTGIPPTSSHAGVQCSNFLDDLEALAVCQKLRNSLHRNLGHVEKDLASVTAEFPRWRR